MWSVLLLWAMLNEQNFKHCGGGELAIQRNYIINLGIHHLCLPYTFVVWDGFELIVHRVVFAFLFPGDWHLFTHRLQCLMLNHFLEGEKRIDHISSSGGLAMSRVDKYSVLKRRDLIAINMIIATCLHAQMTIKGQRDRSIGLSAMVKLKKARIQVLGMLRMCSSNKSWLLPLQQASGL